VWCAKDWVGDEPFLLLLGDHLYSSSSPRSCAGQLIEAFIQNERSVVGLMPVSAERTRQFGIVTGRWKGKDSRTLDITEFVEKPPADYAREHLTVEGMPEDEFLSVFGQYVLTPSVFRHLDANIRNNVRERGEFQLTSCLDKMRVEEGFVGCRVEGERYDIGNPEAYRQTLIDYVNAKPFGG